MEMITRTIVEESNFQNNTTSNTRGEHFSHFRTIQANPFGGFGTFENNNNNNPLLPPLSPPGFGGGLEGEFNPPPEGNARGLDPNVAALVNALTGTNLEINHIERESNHVKPTEFRGTEAE